MSAVSIVSSYGHMCLHMRIKSFDMASLKSVFQLHCDSFWRCIQILLVCHLIAVLSHCRSSSRRRPRGRSSHVRRLSTTRRRRMSSPSRCEEIQLRHECAFCFTSVCPAKKPFNSCDPYLSLLKVKAAPYENGCVTFSSGQLLPMESSTVCE